MKELATLRATTGQLVQMVEQGSGGVHEDLLIRVSDGKVDTLMQTNKRQAISYCTWEDSHFDEVSGEVEAIVPVGGTGMDQKGYLDYLDFASNGEETVEMTFLGEEDVEGRHAPLATHWRAEGALNTELRLPSSDDDLDAVPWDHPIRWTPDDQYVSKRCLTEEGQLPEDKNEWITGPVVIETTVAAVENQIIEPAEFTDGINYYPIMTRDGEFFVEIEGSQQNDSIWGNVPAESVEGPDVTREFQPGFSEIFGTMVGPVRLQTAPSGDGDVSPPMTAVQDSDPNYTIRHLISALAKR